MNESNNHPKTDTVGFTQCLRGTWADRLLLVMLLMGIALLWFQIEKTLSHGLPTAYVYHGKTLLATYPLPKGDKVIHVAAKGEIGVSDIEISQHGIHFVSSPCTTHYCMLSGHKKHTGSVIACVPNHIMVVIRGEAEDTQLHFDAVTE